MGLYYESIKADILSVKSSSRPGNKQGVLKVKLKTSPSMPLVNTQQPYKMLDRNAKNTLFFQMTDYFSVI